MTKQVVPTRKLSPECWAIIGTGAVIVTVILLVANRQRADVRDLNQKIESVQVGRNTFWEWLKNFVLLLFSALKFW